MIERDEALARVDRLIAECEPRIACQRELVAKKVESGEDTEIAETMLRALKGSLEVFESHRKVILSWGMIAGRKRPSPSQELATAIGPAAKGAATRGGSHSQTPQDPCAGGDAGSAAN